MAFAGGVNAFENTPEEDRRLLALEAATPEARELLEAIFAHNERDAKWSENRLAEMDEWERERAIKARGQRIMNRLSEILGFLYDVHPPMDYSEEETPYGTEKSLTLRWLNDYLEDEIGA